MNFAQMLMSFNPPKSKSEKVRRPNEDLYRRHMKDWVTCRKLAEALGFTHYSVSSTLMRYERAGLVERREGTETARNGWVATEWRFVK